MKRGVRGQVTIFVVVGILLIAVFAVGFYMIKGSETNEISDNQNQDDALISEEFKTVNNFVELCIKQVGIEAIKKASEHGGYIDPTDFRYPTNLEYVSSKPTESELVSLTQDDGSLIPYYLHIPGKASSSNFKAILAIPSEELIQKQVSWYLEDKVPECLDDFKSFDGQDMKILPNGVVSYQVNFIDDYMNINANIPLSILKDNKNSSISKFNSRVRSSFMENLLLASEISTTMYITQFSEGFSGSLLSYYSGEDPNLLPPKIQHSSNIYPVTWAKPKVKQDFNNLLLSYVPAIKTTTGEYKNIESEDLAQNFIDSLVFYISNETSNDTQVSFFYPDQTLDLAVNPSKGNLIKPTKRDIKADKYKPGQVDFTYKFFYDISYPLVIEIRNKDLESDIPETSFLFAVESNIIQNKPGLLWELGSGTADWDPELLKMDFNIPGADEEEQVETAKARSDTKSLFCNELTFISGEVSLSAIDETNNPLIGAEIFYSCGEYDTCVLGQTSLIDNQAQWSGKLPLCEGGLLGITKPDYGSASYELSTQEAQPISLPRAQLTREKIITASIKKKSIDKIFTFSRGDNAGVWSEGIASLNNLEDLNGEEQVILTINQLEQEFEPYSATVIFGKDGVESSQIKLVPGKYEVSATLIDYEGLTFPAKCNTLCKVPVGLCLDWDDYPEEATVISTITWGGLEINEATGYFEIKKEDLYKSSNLEFYVLKLPDLKRSNPPGACIEQLDEMDKIVDYTTQFRSELEPVFN